MYVATLGLPMVAPANIFLGVVQLWADESVCMWRLLVFRRLRQLTFFWELYTCGLVSRYVWADSWSSDGCAG